MKMFALVALILWYKQVCYTNGYFKNINDHTDLFNSLYILSRVSFIVVEQFPTKKQFIYNVYRKRDAGAVSLTSMRYLD